MSSKKFQKIHDRHVAALCEVEDNNYQNYMVCTDDRCSWCDECGIYYHKGS